MKLGVSQSLVQSDAMNIIFLFWSCRASRWPNHRLCLQDVRACQPIDWPCNTSGPCCCGWLAWERWSLPLGRYREGGGGGGGGGDGARRGGAGGVFLVQFFGYGRPCDPAAVPAVLWRAVVQQGRVPTVQTAQQTVEILQVLLLGWFLTTLLLCIDKCVADVLLIMQRQVFQQCDSGGCLRFSSSTLGTSCATETGT